MKIRVNPHTVEIVKEQTEPINEREIKVSKCEFEFDEAITSDFVKEAYFTLNGNTYKQIIQNNECDYPSEVLTEKGTLEIGVVAFKVENDEEIIRYNPSPDYFESWVGSLKDAENSEPITPSEMEQFEQELQEGLNEIGDKIDEVDGKITEVNTAITETNNLNLDVSDKVDGDVTVTLTKKDASTKSVVISDGTSLQFMWQGTSLGIKTDDMSEYVFVDLQGQIGPIGPQGNPFQVKKTYATIDLMKADYDNMEINDYVMISGNIEQEDNAKLFVKTEQEDPVYRWQYLADFSGASGIQGPQGPAGPEGPRGKQGETGQTGATGNGIASITKTSTSGLVDTYTITFTDGNTTTFNVENGNGIDHISLTSQSGATKVYTIYYTDGNTTTFTVQDGEVTQEIFDEEVDRLNMIYNAMPKVSGEGTDLTLDNTAECPVYDVELSPSELEQESTSISEGDEYDSPSPEHPQEIHTVSGENSISIFGKNWANSELLYQQMYNHNPNYVSKQIVDGVECINFRNNNYRADFKGLYGTPFKKNTKYIVSCDARVSDTTITDGYALYINITYDDGTTTNSGRINANGSNWRHISFVTDADKTISYISFSYGAITYWLIKNIMISEYVVGETPNYVPYISQTYPISLGDLEYCKIGDYEDVFFKNIVGSEYYDSTLELDKWYLKKNVEKVVFDGSEDGWNGSSFGDGFRTYITVNNSKIYTQNNDYLAYCNYFYKDGRIFSSPTALWGMFCQYKNIPTVYFMTNETSLDNFKTWLSTHNTIVYSVLATPTNILLSDTLQTQLDNIQKAISYQDQTNVSQENADLPFIIKLSAIRDLSGIFEEI
jgi:hypothetical protein